MTTLDILTPSPTALDLSRARAAMRDLIGDEGTGRATTAQQLTRASPTHRVAAIMILLMTGIAIAIVTTPDPLWWHLHFSELGTFDAFSSYVFNGTMIAAGVAIMAFARYFRRQLNAHLARSGSTRRSPAVISMLITSVGVHLAFIGGVPVNTVTFVHDRAAQGMVLSFLALLIATPALLRGLGRALAAITVPAALLLVGGGVAMVMGVINLAAYELLGFAIMFTWVLLFVACLGKHASAHDEAAAELVSVREPVQADAATTRRRVYLRTSSRAITIGARDVAGAPTITRESSISRGNVTPCRPSSAREPAVRRYLPDAPTHVAERGRRSAIVRRIVRRRGLALTSQTRIRANLTR